MTEMIFKELAIDTIMSQPPEPHYPSWYAELIRNLSPVEPNLDEWCTGCKEYDSEHHSCPRFNRVIRETLKDMKNRTIEEICDYWDNESNYCTLNKPSVIDALCDNCDNPQAVCAHYPCKQYLALEKLLVVKMKDDYDPCDECREYGDDYYYDSDGDLMQRCYDCPLRERERCKDE